jgi:Zn-dependent peptidase ImmA (M78 family)
MEQFFVKLNKEKIPIDKQVLEDLLDLSPIKEYKAYINAIADNEISFENLKALSVKAGIPYPLFFAPRKVCDIQIKDKDKNLYEKIPSKEEIKLTCRGNTEVRDVELIVKDLGRKQEFLKKRVLIKAPDNPFIGSIAIKLKSDIPIEAIAKEIREYFEIDLAFLRSIPKNKVLIYLCSCIEKKGILISFSSHNYMPQNLDRELQLSGICIKDRKFPYIFINTRDGDDKPKIIESDGRQIFTLLSMLTCIAMGKFVLSTKTGRAKNDLGKIAYSIAGEILIPRKHLTEIQIATLDDLKEKAHFYKVTPSMLLYRLKDYKKIDPKIAEAFWIQLHIETKKLEPKHKHAPLPVTGYSKYNGERFSKEIIKALAIDLISPLEVKNILFRRGKKMDVGLLSQYSKKYRL